MVKNCILASLMPSISRFFNIIFGGNYISSQWRMSLICAQCTPLCASEMKADLTVPPKVYIGLTIFGCIQWHDFGGGQSKLDVVPAGPRANRGRLKRHLTCRRPLAPKSLLGRLMFGGLQTEVRKSWRKNDASIVRSKKLKLVRRKASRGKASVSLS